MWSISHSSSLCYTSRELLPLCKHIGRMFAQCLNWQSDKSLIISPQMLLSVSTVLFISPTISDSLLHIKNNFRVLLVMCFLTFRWMYIYIIYSIYIHLSPKKKQFTFNIVYLLVMCFLTFRWMYTIDIYYIFNIYSIVQDFYRSCNNNIINS